MQNQTEQRLQRFRGADRWPTEESLAAMLENQTSALFAVRAALPAIAKAAQAIAALLAQGDGRLIYAGAGASIRLAVQDGVELYPTFSWPLARVEYVIAGGSGALTQSVEGAEDQAAEARAEISRLGVGSADIVVAVAASGATPFTVAAAQASRATGALTIGMANNPNSPLLAACGIAIELPTGPEFLAGSTRMTAGTAQKIALNLLSTQTMIELGRVHDGWMIDVVPANDKLVRRSKRIIQELVPQLDDKAVTRLWEQSGGQIKLAVLMAEGAELAEATALLQQHSGKLGLARAALQDKDGGGN